MAEVYLRHRPEDTSLHRIVREHLEEFLRASKEGGGGPLPRFVERALRAYLACGLPSAGFTRLICAGSGLSCPRQERSHASALGRAPAPRVAHRGFALRPLRRTLAGRTRPGPRRDRALPAGKGGVHSRTGTRALPRPSCRGGLSIRQIGGRPNPSATRPSALAHLPRLLLPLAGPKHALGSVTPRGASHAAPLTRTLRPWGSRLTLAYSAPRSGAFLAG